MASPHVPRRLPQHPLRFCMITTFYPPYNFGGDGIYVHRLSNALAERGHRVEVIHCIDTYRALADGDPPAPYNDHPNVVVHGLRSPWGVLSPIATHQTGLPVFKVGRIRSILERGFDVIHYHNISLVGGPRVLEYGTGIKLYTLHEYWLVCPTHLLFRFNRAPCLRPHCTLCCLIHKRPPQWWRSTGLLRTALGHVDRLIGLSRFAIEAHRRRGMDLPMEHLPNFVPPPEDIVPPVAEICADPFFLFVGRLEKLKGLQTIIPLFSRFANARLLVAGTGRYEATLRRIAARAPNVQFLGYVPPAELHTLYRQAVAVIIPSLFFEVFPTVTIEALAHRTPVIVRNIGGLPEPVVESGGGFVYDTEQELVSAMDRLLNDRSLRETMGLRGHQAYLQRWSTEVHLRRYMDLLDEVIATREQLRGSGSTQK